MCIYRVAEPWPGPHCKGISLGESRRKVYVVLKRQNELEIRIKIDWIWIHR